MTTAESRSGESHQHCRRGLSQREVGKLRVPTPQPVDGDSMPHTKYCVRGPDRKWALFGAQIISVPIIMREKRGGAHLKASPREPLERQFIAGGLGKILEGWEGVADVSPQLHRSPDRE